MPSVTTTAELMVLLRRHYIKPGLDLPGGVFVPEVGGNGSWGASARADAIYVGFTSSSGRILVGHEVKISRADWLNELNKPGKADQWADQCHAWYLVVSDPSIVKTGELPAGWGLMSPGKSRTRMDIHTPATVKADHTPSWEAVRSVMARLDTLRDQTIQAAVGAKVAKSHKDHAGEIEKAVQRRLARTPDVDRLRHRLAAVEAALGGEIDFGDDDGSGRWGKINLDDVAQIGSLVKRFGNLRMAVDGLRRQVLTQYIRSNCDRLDQALADFDAAVGNSVGEVSAANG